MLIIGDKIFLANYGAGIVEDVGIIDGISEKDEYIKVYLLFDKMNIFLPKSNLKESRYRIMTDVEKMIQNIKGIYDVPERIEKNWNVRYRKNKEKLHGINIKDICNTLRDLYYLKENQILPQGEEKILERAEGLVASEVSIIFQMKFDECVHKLRSRAILTEMNKF